MKKTRRPRRKQSYDAWKKANAAKIQAILEWAEQPAPRPRWRRSQMR